MARKKPVKKAKKKSAAKPAARKTAKKASKKASKKAPKKAVKKVAKKAPKKAAKPVKRSASQPKAKKAAPRKTAPKKVAAKPAPTVVARKPNLDRPRKTVADIHGIPSSLDMNRSASAAKSGRAEMQDKLSKSNSGTALTAGDVDADWQSAESVGDEAPGGDNPTPDQDVVDDIGRALGIEYADDEELQGGAEIADRDAHRWELDPSSKDDFDDEE